MCCHSKKNGIWGGRQYRFRTGMESLNIRTGIGYQSIYSDNQAYCTDGMPTILIPNLTSTTPTGLQLLPGSVCSDRWFPTRSSHENLVGF